MPEKKTELEIEKNTVSDANKIVQKESTRNKKFEDVRFEAYKDAGGDQMYQRFDGGSLTGRFTQSEMDKGISERKEDSFYKFDENIIKDTSISESNLGIEKSEIQEDAGTFSVYIVVNGFPRVASIKGEF